MLELEDIRKAVRKPRYKGEIGRAIDHHSRLRFHSEPALTNKDSSLTYYLTWMAWVKNILPEDKWGSFESFITYPLPTTDLMRSVWSKIGRVFEARDAVERYRFKDSAMEAEFAKVFNPSDFKRGKGENLRVY